MQFLVYLNFENSPMESEFNKLFYMEKKNIFFLSFWNEKYSLIVYLFYFILTKNRNYRIVHYVNFVLVLLFTMLLKMIPTIDKFFFSILPMHDAMMHCSAFCVIIICWNFLQKLK
jgi:hypothetical protein